MTKISHNSYCASNNAGGLPMNNDVIDIRLLEALAAVMSVGSITGAAGLLGRAAGGGAANPEP
jgi:hypothetical protein